MDFPLSNELRAKAHDLIPGGCHTYAKGDDQYPQLAPGFIVRGLGSRVWDVDGNEFIEYGQGNRCVTLGHAFSAVIEAAQRELALGSNFTRPAPIEVEAAEQFLKMVPAADMVKFCKDGSDATTAAVKLARAATGRDKIAICHDHPFFAINDWFIGTTPLDAGIPQCLRELTVQFNYNDIASVEQLFRDHPGQIACLILEPAKYEDPQDGFLHKVRDLCHAHGALFILDEIISGFRWHNGGGQAYYGIEPDLSTFGKAMANGFSVSALAGKREYMELGGLRHGRERVFLLSTTHGGETHALAAAIATMRVYEREPVIETLYARGQRLLDEGNEVIRRHGLSDYVGIVGKPICLVYYTKDQQGERSQAFRSLLLQEMIRRGVLMATLVVSYTHSNDDIDRTLEALDGALGVYKRALEDGVERYLVGPPSQVVYRRYNNPVQESSLRTPVRASI
jgi:glutamate-1-semialdehyde 2,1-aminomutase